MKNEKSQKVLNEACFTIANMVDTTENENNSTTTSENNTNTTPENENMPHAK